MPLYALLGVALAFALAFACAELLNFLASSGAGANPPLAQHGAGAAGRANSALVQSPAQVALLACAAVALGLVYGVMFGSAEIGRGVFTLHTLRVRVRRRRAARGLRAAAGARARHSAPSPRPSAQTQFIHEEKVALPAGAVIGAVTGFLNEKWRGTHSDGKPVGGAGADAGAGAGDDDEGFGGFGRETAEQQAAGALAAAAAGGAGGRRPADDSIDHEADSSADSAVLFDPFRDGGSSQGLGRRV